MSEPGWNAFRDPTLRRLHARLYEIAGRLQAETGEPVEAEHVILALVISGKTDGYPPADGLVDWTAPSIYEAARRHIRTAMRIARQGGDDPTGGADNA